MGEVPGPFGGELIDFLLDKPAEIFHMVYAYTKGEQGDLTLRQVKVLSRLVREEFK